MKENSRRKMLRGAVAAITVAGAAEAQEPKLEKMVIRSGPKPARPPLYSPAIQYGNLLFISGVGYHEKGDIKVHTEGVLSQIKKQLEDAGSSMNKVLKCSIFLADLKDYAAMNEVYAGKFGDEPPVRTTVAAAGVPGNSLIEIDVIAYI